MKRRGQPLWDTLQQANLVQGPAPGMKKLESPWYVKVMLAFSGWLAAIFLLGFVGLGLQFIIKSSSASLISGGILVIAAFILLRMPRNEFFQHLALAISLTGQALILWGLYELIGHKDALIWLLAALLQTTLAMFMPNFVHRVFSAFFAALAFSITLDLLGLPYIFSGVVMLIAAWAWLNEFRYQRHMSALRATGYGLVLSLIQLKATMLFAQEAMVWGGYGRPAESWIQPWMGEALLGGVTIYIVLQLLQLQQHALFSRLGITTLLGALLICILSLEAPGITVGSMILLLGFAGSNRVLQGLGIAALIFYLSTYYYLLNNTLLEKAQTLFILGLALLTIRWLLLYLLPMKKETGHGR